MNPLRCSSAGPSAVRSRQPRQLQAGHAGRNRPPDPGPGTAVAQGASYRSWGNCARMHLQERPGWSQPCIPWYDWLRRRGPGRMPHAVAATPGGLRPTEDRGHDVVASGYPSILKYAWRGGPRPRHRMFDGSPLPCHCLRQALRFSQFGVPITGVPPVSAATGQASARIGSRAALCQA